MTPTALNKRFTNFGVFPLNGKKDDALYDSGTDTQSDDSERGETDCDLGAIS